MQPVCPQCHVVVRPTDFFCFNCGKNLKTQPIPTVPGTLVLYYLGAVFLPPLGIIWGIRYLTQKDSASKIHGIMLIAITVIELLIVSVVSINYLNALNAQIESQLRF